MRNFRRYLSAVMLCACLWAGAEDGFCADDGFRSAPHVKSRHFTVYYDPSLNPDNLAIQLDVRGKAYISEESADEFTSMVDTLFTRVCEILDMPLFSYEGLIKVCRNAAQVNDIYRGMFGNDLEAPSFYVPELNTIYIAKEALSPWVLGHEMGHAVVCHYFVVPPPPKIAEILSGYIEYQLRRGQS